MIITRLRLHDFGIFYGVQTIELMPGLYVIHGRNGRGKTTLINAVRWALYGHYTDRQGRQVPPEVTLNREAAREGTRNFSVELRLLDGEDHYLIRRTQVVSSAGSPASQLYIERNAAPLTAGDRERAINHLMSENVSRFFLFDGEQLQNYEALLDENPKSQLIKHDIEQILGLPVLDNALTDLDAIRDDLSKRLARQARQTQQLEQFGVRAEQFQNELDSKRSELNELRSQRDQQLGIVKARDEFLQQYEGSLDQLKKVESLESKVADLQLARAGLRGDLGAHMVYAWRDVLAVVIQPRVFELRERLARAQEAAADAMAKEQLATSLTTGQCALCGETLDAAHIRELSNRLAARAGGSEEQVGPEVVGQLALLASIVNTGHSVQAIDVDERLADLESEELAQKQELAKLRDVIENLPESDVKKAQIDRDEAHQAIGELNRLIRDAEGEERAIEDQLRRAQDEIMKSAAGNEQRHLGRALDYTRQLRTIFETTRARYRDQLRDAVEASATEVFLSLTNEPEHARLSINNNYGLEIVDKKGGLVINRSAGQEQVVALSLVAALNRNAQRNGPVMMDTPFGRLDPEHSDNILRFLSQLAEQVFLLVHGREVRDEDLNVIRDHINEQFELRRVDADRTLIAVRTHDA